MYPAAVILIKACCVALFSGWKSIQLFQFVPEAVCCHAELVEALPGICTGV
jgi:hypothetical protein